jgi:type II secretory pathway pseudopilin PulG
MTLVEMMIATIVFTVAIGATLSFLSAQLRSFDRRSSDSNMLQNLGFAGELMKEDLRLAGAGVPTNQPYVVYAGTGTFIYNADYASNTDSLSPAYYNPGLPSAQTEALQASDKFNLPGTSPAWGYPDSNYYATGSTTANSPAETIAWFFSPDSSTADPNDYVLYRQVNNNPPEPVVRSVYQTSGLNFFKYYYQRVPAAGTASSSLDSVPTAWMPLKHSIGYHGAPADTGAVSRIDSLARVDVSFTVTNGRTAVTQRSRAITFSIPLPNAGVAPVTNCGSPPILGTSVAGTWVIYATTPPDTVMRLTWSQATDETTGERDVRSYVIWRRVHGATTWDEPIATVPAGSTTPQWDDQTAVQGGAGYDYALAAQDCTPALSTMATVTPHVSYP